MTDLGMEMQPDVWKENYDDVDVVYRYKTYTGKGHYEFIVSDAELRFEGLRNSFGTTAYFSIGKSNGRPCLFSKEEKVLLELIEFCTSAPDIRFWLFSEDDNTVAEETPEPDPNVNGEVATAVRIHGDIEEHMHQSIDYWHPATRVHIKA
jgi:hypothetical protein